MTRLSFAPLALALLALAACGQKAAAPTAKPDSVKAVSAPAGTVWSDHVDATDQGIRMGNPDAPLKLIEYGSYTCPHCSDFSAEAHDPLIKNYVDTGKVSFEYRSLIRDELDLTVALVARCGGTEPFFALSTQLFANQNAMYEELQKHSSAETQAAAGAAPDQRFLKLAELTNLIEFAKQRGLPEDKVRACLADQAQVKKLVEVTNEVLKKYPQFPGTPSFLLNDALLDDTASWEKLEPKLRGAGA